MNRRHWTDIELEILRRNYADSATEDIARALERSPRAVYDMAEGLGLRKSEAYLAALPTRLDGTTGTAHATQTGTKTVFGSTTMHRMR